MTRSATVEDVVTEIVKAGTSEGAKKGWETRRLGQDIKFSSPQARKLGEEALARNGFDRHRAIEDLKRQAYKSPLLTTSKKYAVRRKHLETAIGDLYEAGIK